ncbi:uncharacterized protein GGS22DRAFT_173887 [Annulohypoxylon maeteangense]|uniref:uncharacterized protein n=1 Tax=Annulohypoxylon maeteangense TaxID=1927788 RepID=UPI0020085BB7|nr:uncharacterized protein GGS22DRAFT_173887 [Annulohypoxylon maeteangense]KAI0880975.1 hypothetical protein GGS22DRAFT_173887 [Annulohypoxylon maeteangense]
MASITTRNGQRCTAVPKVAKILLASNSSSTSLSSSSSSTSTSTSTSSTSTSISTSTLTSASVSSTSASSISTTSSLLFASSSSTSISIPTDPQATPVDNPAQPDSATQISSDTSSSASSTISTAAIANTPPVFIQPAIGQSADQSPSTDQSTDQTTSALPASIVSTANDASLPSDSGVLTDAGPTPSQPGDQTQSTNAPTTDGAAPAQSLTGQPGDSSIVTGLDGNTATLTAGATQSIGSSSVETETNGGGLSTTQQQVTGNAITTQQTIAIAGGVVGGVIFISSLAFLIWIWRKRKMHGRRSTLLTPLSPDATFRDREKDPYLIDRSSLGPTPMSEKLWAVVGMKYKRLRGRVNDIVARSNSPSPSVNLDRGNSQFGPLDGAHSRNNSNAGIIGGPPTTKGRFVDWWGRLAEDGNFNWRLRHESKADAINNESYSVPKSTGNNNAPRVPSQPDFLTLLNMDDRQLEQAARVRNSVRGSQRRSISMGNEQHFLGGLGLNFDDPFSDVNAIGNNTAKAKPVVVSAANNPFSDANAIAAPSAVANGGLATYVQNVRRSRGHSVNGGGISRQPSNAGTRMNSAMNSMYRESNASISTVGTRRNKFRSDPFDLDRPDLLSANSSFDATVRESSRSSKGAPVPVPNTPRQAHVRTESFTSKYSSGVSGVSMSMSQWSDPGPDVGPAAARYTPTPDNGIARRDSDTRRSGGSQGSVGKAL